MQITMRLLLVLLAFGFVPSIQASEQVAPVLSNQFAQSITNLSNKLKECRESEQKLDVDKLSKLGISQDQLKIVLAYQFSRLGFECSKAEYAEYLIASKAMQEFTSEEGKEIVEKLDAIIVSNEKSRWDAMQRYSLLPEEVQNKVSQSNLFTSPFNLIDSLPL